MNDFIESKKHINDKIKELLKLEYDYDDNSLNFPDGRKLDAYFFPRRMKHNLTKEEKTNIYNLIDRHILHRPFEAIEFLKKYDME